MPKGGALKSVHRVTAAELKVNGGRYFLQQGPAIKVRGFNAASIGARRVIGGDALPVYVLTNAQIRENGGRWIVTAGEAIQVTDVIGVTRGVIQGAAVPVYPVDDNGVYDPTF